MAFDGRCFDLIADERDVIVVDAGTYELLDTIEPLTIRGDPSAVTLEPGALWVATGITGILQRFDIPS